MIHCLLLSLAPSRVLQRLTLVFVSQHARDMAPPALSPSPPPQWQQQNGAGIPRTGTANPNHTQDPKAGLSGGAYALAGQAPHESPARPLPGVAAEERHGDSTQQMDDQAHLSGTPGARTLSVEELRRLGQQWKAQGRKACNTCGKKHPPPCNPGIVKKRKIKAIWCRSCREHHLFGQHTRTKQEAAKLLTQQAYGMAPVSARMMTPPGDPDTMAEELANAEQSGEIRMMLIHQVPQLLRDFSYQEKLDLRADLFPGNVATAFSWEQHVFMQYLQESIESDRGEESSEDEGTVIG